MMTPAERRSIVVAAAMIERAQIMRRSPDLDGAALFWAISLAQAELSDDVRAGNDLTPVLRRIAGWALAGLEARLADAEGDGAAGEDGA